jgi:hypothetical protein
MTSEWWQRLRRLRAAPPALADKGARKATFGAALQQAEDLAAAATTIGPWAQPILLYYSLNQAGRAVIAAHWRDKGWSSVSSHGLAELAPDTRGGGGASLEQYRVESFPTGWFPALAEAAGSPTSVVGQFRLGDVWGAIPDLLEVDLPFECRRPLVVQRRALSGPLGGEISQDVRANVFYGKKFLEPNAFASLAKNYPLDGWSWHNPQGAGQHRARYEDLEGWELSWDIPRQEGLSFGASEQERIARLNQVAPQHRYVEQRFVLPTVGGVDFTPLGLWAMLLFTLSSIARYRSSQWVAALDLDSSPLAAPLRESLAIAADVVPHLVYQAALGERVLVRHLATGR